MNPILEFIAKNESTKFKSKPLLMQAWKTFEFKTNIYIMEEYQNYLCIDPRTMD